MSYYPHWTVETCLSHGGCHYDPDKGERPIRFIEQMLRHQKGRWRGQPLKLVEWQREIIRMAYGVIDDETSLRRFTLWSIWLPRKSGKTTLVAGLAMYELGWGEELGAEVLIGASTREQANLTFQFATYNAAEGHPTLQKRLNAKKLIIEDPRHGGTFKTVSRQAGAVHGTNPSFAVADELHVHIDGKLAEAFRTGQGAREQPIYCTISTAGVVGSFAKAEFDLAENVLRGRTQQSNLLPVIYGADPAAEFDDRSAWAEAMPSLGVSVSERFIEGEADAARNSASKKNSFRNLYLNIWTSNEEDWIQAYMWQRARRDLPALFEHEGKPRAYVGIDLSTRRDLTCVSVMVTGAEGPTQLYTTAFLPEAMVEKTVMHGAAEMQAWITEGYVRVCPGETIDHEQVRRFLLQVAEHYDVGPSRYDPWGSDAIVAQLETDGFELTELKPNMHTMSPPTEEFEARIAREDVVHEGHGMMAWFVGNVTIERNAQNHVRPSKKRSKNKIDGAVSAIIAMRAVMDAEADEVDDGATPTLFVI